jgi:cyclohexadienyl dehydratase
MTAALRRAVARTCAAAVVAALALPAGAPAAEVRATPTVAKLRVGTSGDYAPFSFRDASGGLQGFDVEVARRLAKDLLRPVEFVAFRWPDLLPRLRAREFDVAMSGVTVRTDRAVHVLFTRPYAVTGAVAVLRSADGQTLRSLGDLNRPHIRVAVNAGGHLERVARRHLPQADIRAVAANEKLAGLVSSGRATAAISEEFEASTWEGSFAVIGPFTRDRKAYALPAQSHSLWRRVDAWLAAREADGSLNRLRRRWLGDAAVMTAQNACFEAIAAAVEMRLSFMPLVRAVKGEAGLPIEVPSQEERVLRQIRTAAEKEGLHGEDMAGVFRLLIEASKAVQRHAPASSAGGSVAAGAHSLQDLRRAIGVASEALIVELRRCHRWLDSPAARNSLQATLRKGIRVEGLPAGLVEALPAALAGVRVLDESPGSPQTGR